MNVNHAWITASSVALHAVNKVKKNSMTITHQKHYDIPRYKYGYQCLDWYKTFWWHLNRIYFTFGGLTSLSHPDEHDFWWGFNPRLFWEPTFVYAKQCVHIRMTLRLTGCLTDHVLRNTKLAPAKDTFKKNAQIQTGRTPHLHFVHTHFSLR